MHVHVCNVYASMCTHAFTCTKQSATRGPRQPEGLCNIYNPRTSATRGPLQPEDLCNRSAKICKQYSMHTFTCSDKNRYTCMCICIYTHIHTQEYVHVCLYLHIHDQEAPVRYEDQERPTKSNEGQHGTRWITRAQEV